MIRSFKQMQDAVLLDARKPGVAAYIPTVRQFLNQTYMELMGQIYVPQQVEVFPITGLTSARTYTLPADFNGFVGLHVLSKGAATASTTLGADVALTDTTLTVADTSSLASSGYLTIDNEILHYSSVTSSILLSGVEHGSFSTVASTHSSGATVTQAGDASYARDISRGLMPIEKFDQRYPKGYSDNGQVQPGEFRIKKVEGVLTRNTGTAAIKAYSSSALDAGVEVACLAYESSTRQTVTHGKCLLTAASITEGTAITLANDAGASMTSYEPIQVSKSGDSRGIITVFRASTPTVTLGTLSPWQTHGEYEVLEFADVFDDVYSFNLRYIRMPVPMVNDSDIPFGFPSQFTEVIEWGAKYRMRDLGDDLTRTKEAKSRFDEMTMKLKASFPKATTEQFGFTWG